MVDNRRFRSPLRRTAGFTLLEVLLATVLMAALLLTLWSLIGTYTSLFASGQAKTEQSQIAHALLQQMCDDLQSTIQDTSARPRLQGSPATADSDNPAQPPANCPADGQPSDPSAVRRFGLFGSRHELRIDVLQIVPVEVSLAAAQADDDSSTAVSNQFDDPRTGGGLSGRRRAPELRTVCYAFNRPQDPGDNEELSRMDDAGDAGREEMLLGLVREEIDFETRSPSGIGTRLAGRPANSSTEAAAGDETEAETDARIDSGSVLWVPEVLDVEFRYFDGGGWTTQWDSIERKSLPVAVEIRLEIESLDPRAVRRRTAEEMEADKVEFVGPAGPEEEKTTGEIRLEADKESKEDAVADAGPADRKTYRLVVELPTARLHKGTRKPATSANMPLREPPSLSTKRLDQTILPSPKKPSLHKSRTDKKAAERWLRSDPQ